jgi:ubiquitin carboxyl-terminal hydrolase 1
MDHPYYQHLEIQRHVDQTRSLATYLAYSIAAIYLIHQVLVYYDYPLLSPQEILWNALVYITPKRLLLDSARRQELKANGMLSQTHAAKSEALRRVMGMGGNAVLQKLPAEGIMRRMSGVGRLQVTSDAPPGLGNWDNSCYQNSVLQGLASLDSFKEYLGVRGQEEGESTTTSTLQDFVGKLNDGSNNGRHLWTPAKLKNMSSWQQQDAQEYYSKILDELDKEASKSFAASTRKPGLETIAENESESEQVDAVEADEDSDAQKNPLDGLLAQRVACTKCGYSEGLSMIPFNCLTLPLGSSETAYLLEECLDEYTKLEEISDVECGKCTLLRAEQQLTKMLPPPPTYRSADAEPAFDCKTLSLPPELRAQAFQRLSAIQHALSEDDFADKTLHETCQIPKKARVSTTKTRQAVIGRAPQSLALHVNRSVFDETTGIQRKNYAHVRWPARLDLKSWVLPPVTDEGEDATSSLLRSEDDKGDADVRTGNESLVYRIKAVVTHYGRHENGHYICYRQHPVRPRVEEELDSVDEEVHKPDSGLEMRWWRLSDEDVTSVSESEVLKQGGVFMLFYEREQMPTMPPRQQRATATAVEAEDAAIDFSSLADLVEAEQTNGKPPPPDCEAEEIAQAEISIPEPSPAPSSSIETETEDASTNPTTPASVTTDSTSPFDQDPPSTDATTEDEFEFEPEQKVAKEQMPPPPATPPMRTARSQRPESPPGSTNKDGGFGVSGSGFRAVAAT